MPLRDAAATGINALRYRYLNTTDDAVQLGRDGWLFLTQELHLEPDGLANMECRADAVIALAKRLEARQVRLIVAPVPAKGRIYPQQLPSGAFPSALALGYDAFATKLERSGVAVARLDQALQRHATEAELYCRTDTHWNMAGARVAALALATTVGRLGLHLPKTAFATTPSAEVSERVGDLTHLMSLDALEPPWRPHGDRDLPSQTSSLGAANLGLLGAPDAAAIVLIGTSYSLRGNFVGALQQSLGSAVLNLAKEGSGFAKRMIAYLNDESLRDAPPKVLIWEFNERFLYLPTDAATNADLEGLVPPQPTK